MAMECFSLANPNPNPNTLQKIPLTTPSIPRFSSTPSQFTLRIDHFRRNHSSPVCIPRGICGFTLLPVRTRRPFLQLATPHDDSTPLESESEKERSELDQGKELDEVWRQALAAFKEQALKLRGVSQEAYVIYSEKAMIILKETSKKLKIEAAKASYDISIIAREFGEEGGQYIAQAAANSPEPVKEVVQTFAYSTQNVKDVSQIRDFYVGVPYGAILSLGGFLNFMITGSTSGIRFGVILGGILLALSVSSLRSWRKGKPSDGIILKCETAIAGILFLRNLRLFFQKVSFPSLLGTAISGAVSAFFIYRLMMFGQDAKESNMDGEPQT